MNSLKIQGIRSNQQSKHEEITMDNSGSTPPNNAPIATPVNAPCPRESEKNAIRLLTTIVPNSPNKGVINRTAKNAFFMKL